MTRILKLSTAALLAGAALVSAAQAGGYSRGSANLDPLLGDPTSLTSSFTFVSPSRSIDAVNGVATTGGAGADFAASYYSWSGTGTVKFNDAARCAASYAQPFGADSDYGTAQLLAGTSTTTAASLKSDELGLTCSYGFSAGPGQLFAVGGVFHQNIEYTESKGAFIGPNFVDNVAGINLSDGAIGYRMGIGYAIPEIALKASIMYRSAVDHTVTGVQTLSSTAATGAVLSANSLTLAQYQALGIAAAGGNPAAQAQFSALNSAIAGLTGSYDAYAVATTPQSVKLSIQTGVAEGTLVFGSVEWTDWSVLQQVQVLGSGTGSALAAAGYAGVPTPGAPTIDAFFRDGWTVNLGLARQFNEQLSGVVAYTWDRGVSQGRGSGFGDNHTFALGANFAFNPSASIRGGLAYTYLGSSTYATTGIGGVPLTVTNGSSQAIAGALSFNVKF